MPAERPDHDPAEPTIIDLRAEQHEEMEHLGLGTRGQRQGALVGGIVGGLAGLLTMLVVSLVVFGDVGGVHLVLPVLGLAFGAVAGLVYEGGRNPERADELRAADGEPDASAAVASNPPTADEP